MCHGIQDMEEVSLTLRCNILRIQTQFHEVVFQSLGSHLQKVQHLSVISYHQSKQSPLGLLSYLFHTTGIYALYQSNLYKVFLNLYQSMRLQLLVVWRRKDSVYPNQILLLQIQTYSYLEQSCPHLKSSWHLSLHT